MSALMHDEISSFVFSGGFLQFFFADVKVRFVAACRGPVPMPAP